MRRSLALTLALAAACSLLNAALALAQDLPSGWTYVGCLYEGPNRILADTYGTNDTVTITSCVGRCIRMGTDYAGMVDGFKCYCGNTLRGIQPATEQFCTLPCPGGGRGACGGTAYMSIYSRRGITLAPPAGSGSGGGSGGDAREDEIVLSSSPSLTPPPQTQPPPPPAAVSSSTSTSTSIPNATPTSAPAAGPPEQSPSAPAGISSSGVSSSSPTGVSPDGAVVSGLATPASSAGVPRPSTGSISGSSPGIAPESGDGEAEDGEADEGDPRLSGAWEIVTDGSAPRLRAESHEIEYGTFISAAAARLRTTGPWRGSVGVALVWVGAGSALGWGMGERWL